MPGDEAFIGLRDAFDREYGVDRQHDLPRGDERGQLAQLRRAGGFVREFPATGLPLTLGELWSQRAAITIRND